MASERRVVRYVRGAPVHRFERITGRRAEALDCLVYAMAARLAVTASLDVREADMQSAEAPTERSALIRSAWLSA